MRKLAIVSLMLCACATAHASDTGVYAAEGVYQALDATDMLTTLDIRKHPGDYECNPILGKHPSDAYVVGYFVASGVSHYLVTRALVNAGYTKTAYLYEALGISFEASLVSHNLRMGLSLRF